MFSLAYKVQYHNFEKDMMLTGTQCMTRAWMAHKAYRSCLKWHIKIASSMIGSLEMCQIEIPKIVHFFLKYFGVLPTTGC